MDGCMLLSFHVATLLVHICEITYLPSNSGLLLRHPARVLGLACGLLHVCGSLLRSSPLAVAPGFVCAAALIVTMAFLLGYRLWR